MMSDLLKRSLIVGFFRRSMILNILRRFVIPAVLRSLPTITRFIVFLRAGIKLSSVYIICLAAIINLISVIITITRYR